MLLEDELAESERLVKVAHDKIAVLSESLVS